MSDYLIVRTHYELANIVLAVAFFRTKVEGFIEVISAKCKVASYVYIIKVVKIFFKCISIRYPAL